MHFRAFKLSAFYTICFILPEFTFAQKIIDFNTKEISLPLNDGLYFLEDKSSSITFEQLLSDSLQTRFQPANTERLNFGNTRSAIWCKFTVKNSTDRACFLQLERPLITDMEIFIPFASGRYSSKKFGALYPWHSREIKTNVFFVRLLESGLGPSTIYIRFKSEFSLDIPMSLGTMESCLAIERDLNIQYILLGLLIAMLIFNVFLYLMVKERTYLFYTLSLFFIIISLDMIFTGLGFQYLWSDFPSFNLFLSSIISLSFLFTTLFARLLLNTAENAPRLHKFQYVLFAGSAIIIILNVAGTHFIADLAVHLLAMVYSIYLIVLGIYIFFKGFSIAGYFVISTIVSLCCIIFNILYLENLLPAGTVSYNAIFVGHAIEALLFAFALANKIKLLRTEREHVQKEKVSLIENQKNTLERLVQERTEEIATQNEEIMSQNEELTTQQEQISLQVDSLEKARAIIQSQHETLVKYTSGLEDKVDSKEKDLVKVNYELMQQNSQLEQFAFVIAHNLRSPVARILGLGNVLQYVKDDPKEINFVHQKIEESTRELDNVLRDLSRILEIRKGSGKNLQLVSIPESCKKIIKQLNDEINTADAIVTTNFMDAKEIYSIPQYIDSILFHLLSNALKYKSPARRAAIFITVRHNSNVLRIIVEDNGLGLELDKYREKIFALYQRFHLHVEGKGMGLHLVKLQTEALGGTVTVKSKLNEGSVFEVILPDHY
jgi:signal transduction histidine kinase